MAHLVLTRLALWSNEFTRETDIHTHIHTYTGKENERWEGDSAETEIY